jgi:hypothetical protein
MAVYVSRLCLACGYKASLKSNDTFNKHKDKNGEICEGSYKTVAEARNIYLNRTKPPIFKKSKSEPTEQDQVVAMAVGKPWWKLW